MKAKIRLKLNCILLVAALVTSVFTLVACNDDPPYNPYAHDNDFEVTTTDCEDALEFAPEGFTPTCGVVLYIGILENPEDYSYLGNALARQGYLAAISKVKNLNPDGYHANIPTFLNHPEIKKFFVGGHDIGGGLAVRHAMDYAKNGYNVAGVILYAPLSFSNPKKDENGQPVLDGQNNPIIDHFDISDYDIDTLLLEVDEPFRTDEMKQIAKEHINNSIATCYTLSNSKSTYFSTMTSSSATDENAIAQREKTVEYTLEFLKSLSK
ncbi:MAG: alpha/beta hydrolase [Bacteroides sp.]|nr:alpha/beta hydrolase [Bacillota bacterium]MCM1393580.1 alpha/beta hydrolase [[Eubacterium] siraeum]MCM1455001.1 alpha/beta hydrolase [Bacteroides sp.]